MVPPAKFTSYYGRPVLKASPWTGDIPAYLFLGGLAGGSSLLAAGADLSDRPVTRRASRLAALAGITGSLFALVHDLGKPSRFLNMLRVAKVTSPMSVGTWILTAYGPFAGLAAVAEFVPFLKPFGRPAGLAAAAVAPAVASYTAVLLADTATPAWHEAYRELPFVFAGSAAAAAGGLAMMAAPLSESGPAQRFALGGAALELAVGHRMESSMGLASQALHEGPPGQLMKASRALTIGGMTVGLAARRSRACAVVAGAMLVAGSVATRFGIFEAGQASARDPKYTVVPQRARLDERG
ncbi:MAG TPA: NrfD/PsrC family molybdoenzyme membrane anchor subunit [Mycobacteriales bacterium]|jgi:formate-dependent nitrite reductase membrane component NrfD|nr:NrfD/PsrC family molybdoenzyme membrane anchor subunit [Mycobacteriales bacterium]